MLKDLGLPKFALKCVNSWGYLHQSSIFSLYFGHYIGKVNIQLLEITKVLFISASVVVTKGRKPNCFQFKLEKVHPGNINTPPHGTPVIGNSKVEGVFKCQNF